MKSVESKETKTRALIARVITLWELKRAGRLDLSHGAKVDFARFFGVSRPTMDNALLALAEAEEDVAEILKRKIPSRSAGKLAGIEQLACERLARRAEPGAWLDETQYNEVLQLAGLHPEGSR